MGRSIALFPETKMPFQLRYFVARPDYDCGDISPHMGHLEIVEGVCAMRQKEYSFIKGLQSAASTLREWIDCPEARWGMTDVVEDEYGTKQLPDAPIIFPNLRKLNALWCEHFLKAEFPALEEASLNSLRTKSYVGRNRVASIISKSPTLKKLHILLPPEQAFQTRILTTVAELEHLEELHLWCNGTFSLRPLIDAQLADVFANDSVDIICPKLHTIGLVHRKSSWSSESEEKLMQRDLIEFLILRFYFERRLRLDEAKKRLEAALVGHGESVQKMNQTQKKKLIADAMESTSASSYKGMFVKAGNLTREAFAPVLSRLVLTNQMARNILKKKDELGRSLIDCIRYIDHKKEWSSKRGDYDDGDYY